MSENPKPKILPGDYKVRLWKALRKQRITKKTARTIISDFNADNQEVDALKLDMHIAHESEHRERGFFSKSSFQMTRFFVEVVAIALFVSLVTHLSFPTILEFSDRYATALREAIQR